MLKVQTQLFNILIDFNHRKSVRPDFDTNIIKTVGTGFSTKLKTYFWFLGQIRADFTIF